MRTDQPIRVIAAIAIALLPLQAFADGLAAREAGILADWTALLDTPWEAVAKHDLAWIKAGARDDPKQPAFYRELEIDRRSLEYLGYLLPGKAPPFQSAHTIPAALTKPHHIYRYRDAYVLTQADGRREQLCVYAVARALDLLRALYPREFKELFVGPRTPGEQLLAIRRHDKEKTVSFVNLTAHHAIVIGGGNSAIAESSYVLGRSTVETIMAGKEVAADVAVFRNVATTYLDLPAIQGHGSWRLYTREEPLQNFIWYLRDGLLETLVHEALHALVRRDKNVRPRFWAISESVRELAGPAVSKSCEEAFVANVSTRLFLERGGVSEPVLRYYQRRFLGYQRKAIGLEIGNETDKGVALRALFQRFEEPDTPYPRLFWFPIVPIR